MQILKLGGSIITERERYCIFNDENIRRIGIELKPYIGRLILVHGMGSFGRAFLPIYNQQKIPASQACLARTIQQNLHDFHNLIVNTLLSVNVPASSLDPEAVFGIHDGTIVFVTTEILLYHLHQGRVPVLYGGTVWDDIGCFTILSSDQIVGCLALKLGARRVIWASDVDGVLSCPSAGPPKIIQVLCHRNLHLMWYQESDEADCTGGMANKVKISLHLADHGIPSFVVNGRRPGIVEQALDGNPGSGTLIFEDKTID